MIVAILTIIASFFSLAKIIIEKFVPSHVTKKREFKSKKKAIDAIDKSRLITIEQIARFGKNKGII